MFDLLNLMKEHVTPAGARNWAARVMAKLSKRDNDDLLRLRARIGDCGIIRYFAAGHMDPMFCGPRVEKVHRAFGEAIEAAYHKLVADLAIATEADKAAHGYHYLVERGYDVSHGPDGWSATLNGEAIENGVGLMTAAVAWAANWAHAAEEQES